MGRECCFSGSQWILSNPLHQPGKMVVSRFSAMKSISFRPSLIIRAELDVN